MIDALQVITAALREITPEAYFTYNKQLDVVYPYMTFDIQNEAIERNVEGVYVDVEIFDHNTSFARIFELEHQLKVTFKDFMTLTDEVLVRFEYRRANTVPTGDDTIKRRNIQLYCIIDWRNL